MNRILIALFCISFSSIFVACTIAEEKPEKPSNIKVSNEKYLFDLAMERISNYQTSKQWGEKLNFHTTCEIADSIINAENTEITDLIIQVDCPDISLTNYVNKFFLTEQDGQEKIVSVLCYSDGYSYLVFSSMIEDMFSYIVEKK